MKCRGHKTNAWSYTFTCAIELNINADHLPSHLQTQRHSGTHPLPNRIKCCTRPQTGWLQDHEPKVLQITINSSTDEIGGTRHWPYMPNEPKDPLNMSWMCRVPQDNLKYLAAHVRTEQKSLYLGWMWPTRHKLKRRDFIMHRVLA